MITPCISICVIDPETELCEGCGRTLDEISNWSRMTAEERRAVMAELAGRREDRSVPA
jgi:predicted Fe-S protein YdhL (DUF1289 family)